jgi:multicomponent K+:H+ antiporter subunit G
VHEVLVTAFLFLTAPVSAHLLVRAHLARQAGLPAEPPGDS